MSGHARLQKQVVAVQPTKRAAKKPKMRSAHRGPDGAPSASWTLSGPTSYRADGSTVVGRYSVAGDAIASDSAHNDGAALVVTADLELLFWGDYWLTAANPSTGDIVNAVTKLLASPYLKGLSQYGFQQLNLRGSTIVRVPGPPAPTYSADSVRNMVWDLIDTNVFPEPDDAGGRIIYMTFAPDGSVYDDTSDIGAHTSARDVDVFDVDYAWVAWCNFGDLPYVTKIFSHELVETLTNPEPSSDSNAWQMNRELHGGFEIGDACNNTVDRLDGLEIQGYWSEKDKACIIPWHSFSAMMDWSIDVLTTETVSNGVATVSAGPCYPPAPYQWFVRQHQEAVTYVATTQGIEEPSFSWQIDGQKAEGTGDLTVNTSVSHPDVNGQHMADGSAHVHYEQNGPNLRMTNSPADGTFGVDITCTVNDARAGTSTRARRVLTDSSSFDGQVFEWEAAYYQARQNCLGYLRGIGRRALDNHGIVGGPHPSWVEQQMDRYRPEDQPQVRDLAHLASALQDQPGINEQLNAMLKTFQLRP